MANYAANARTNRFRVRDIDALKAELAEYGITTATWEESRRGAEFILDDDPRNSPTGAIALFSFGTWPGLDEDSVADRLEIEDDATPVPNKHESLVALVASHLIEGEVAVFMEVGFESMRYLGGVAVAVNAAGEIKRVDLDDIYDLAKESLGATGEISRAEY